MTKNNYYAVKKGRKPGIYPSWAKCKEQIEHFSGAMFKKFTNEAEAAAYIAGESSSKPAFYAVKTGHVPGIYESWEECKAQTDGFSNPVFRKFGNREMAEKWLKTSENDLSEKGCRAYVDGSFNADLNVYGYGVVLLYGKAAYEFSGRGADPAMAAMRNVAGEIEGAMRAVREAIEMGFSSVQIYYDYRGIECWVTGEWAATKADTIRYRKYMKEKGKHIKIQFSKVRAHSGAKYNERADELAKMAIGIKKKED